eukprot:TRINITY_DN44765_c0_g1_i1.p1 TRINITY_DN44765_c0_g1~~TRINITY_DN44765_c0_g1_i1.p1  ORF type:complete len:343 (+),score=80.85 TRINITY_DN44765_c0_g1_i1:43-1029(+)
MPEISEIQEGEDEGGCEHDKQDKDEAAGGLSDLNFAELLGPDCVIKRVDKNQKVIGHAKPEEMKHELMSRASTQKRIGACAEHVKEMSWEDKLKWALDLKDKANELYSASNFEDAARLYNDCLVALDLDGSPEKVHEVKTKLQLPVCTNLAACLIEMGKYETCVEMCSIALGVDAKSSKAMFRRGLSYFRLGNYRLARQDLEATLRAISEWKESSSSQGEAISSSASSTCAGSDAEATAMVDLERRARHYLLHIQRFGQQERANCKKMFDRRADETHLYDDRPGAKEAESEEDVEVDDSDEAIEAKLRELKGSGLCCCRRSSEKTKSS